MANTGYNVDALLLKSQVVVVDTTIASSTSGSLVVGGGLSTQDTFVTGHAAINHVKITPNLNDIIHEREFSLTNTSGNWASITDFYFLNSVTTAFKANIYVEVGSQNALWELSGVLVNGDWNYNSHFTGDLINVDFGVLSLVTQQGGTGHVHYKNSTGQVGKIRYRATTNAPVGTDPVGVNVENIVIDPTTGNYVANSLLYTNTANTVANVPDIKFNSGLFTVEPTTDMVLRSTETATSWSQGGALTVMGDASVAKSLLVNARLGVGTVTPNAAYAADIAGDLNVSGAIYVDGNVLGSSAWSTTGANVYLSTGNLGIGTSNPTSKLTVAGDLSATSVTTSNISVSGGISAGSVYLSGDLYKNGQLFSSSQWVTGASSKISYTAGAVEVADMTAGNVNLTGNLYKNGQLFSSSQWVTGASSKISYTAGAVEVADMTAGNVNLTGNLYKNGQLFSSSQWVTGANSSISYTAGAVEVSTFQVGSSTTFGGDLIPKTDISYDLGSSSRRWRDLYLKGSTIYLGEGSISYTASGISLGNLVSPTIDTITERVQTVETNVGNVDVTALEATAGSLLTSVNNLNTLIGSANTSIGNLSTLTSNLSTSIGSTNTSIGNLVTDFNTSIGNANTSIGNLSTLTSNLNTSIGSANTSIGNIKIGLTTGSLNTVKSPDPDINHPTVALTSNVSTSYTAASSSSAGGAAQAYHAFDNSTSTSWTCATNAKYSNGIYIGSETISTNNGNISGEWISLTSIDSFVLNQFSITTRDDPSWLGWGPKDFTLVARNGNDTWTVLYTKTNETWSSITSTKQYNVSNILSYNQYMLITQSLKTVITSQFITIHNFVLSNINNTGQVIANVGMSAGSLFVTGAALLNSNVTVGSLFVSSSSTLNGQVVAAAGMSAGSLMVTGASALVFNSNTIGSIFTTGANVGIGTTTPTNILTVRSSSNSNTGVRLEYNTGTGQSNGNYKESPAIDFIAPQYYDMPYKSASIRGGNQSGGLSFKGVLEFRTVQQDSDVEPTTAMRIVSDNVGIGITAPESPLHVKTGVNYNGNNIRYFDNTWSNGQGIAIANGFSPLNSIIGEGSILSKRGFFAISDTRIKKDILDINDASALNTFRQLKPKSYKYIDIGTHTDETVYGFLAQEVEEVLPHAVDLKKDYIPNVFLHITVGNNGTHLTLPNTGVLQNQVTDGNTKIPLKCYIDEADTEQIVNVINIIDTSTVEIDNPITTGSIIFCYGQEVSDFHTLNKDVIWTVATAALQEVDRQLQETIAENETLKTQLEATKTKIASQEATINSLVAFIESKYPGEFTIN